MASNVSSSGTTLTVPNQQNLLQPSDMSPTLISELIEKVSGTGTIPANTTIVSVPGPNTIILSAAPSPPLSNAIIRTTPRAAKFVRSLSGIYLTTTFDGQITQLNYTGTIALNANVVALNAGGYASAQIEVGLVRLPYVANQLVTPAVLAADGVLIYQATFVSPIVFLTTLYRMTVSFAFASIIDNTTTAGDWVYFPVYGVQNLNGTMTFLNLEARDITSSGTVLKR
jgi:hypothetical protein